MATRSAEQPPIANRQFNELQIQQAAILGAHPGAPLINVASKLNSQFNDASGKKKAERTQDVMMSIIMQQLLRDLEEQLEAIDADLNTLSDIRQMMEDGTFDPLNNDDHLKMLQQIDAQMTREKWDGMAMHEQSDWLQDHVDRLNEERSQVENNIELISNPDAEINAVNNRFESELFETAARNYEMNNGVTIDRHNPTEEDLDNILKETYNIHLEQKTTADSIINISSDIDSSVSMSNMGIKNSMPGWS